MSFVLSFASYVLSMYVCICFLVLSGWYVCILLFLSSGMSFLFFMYWFRDVCMYLFSSLFVSFVRDFLRFSLFRYVYTL